MAYNEINREFGSDSFGGSRGSGGSTATSGSSGVSGVAADQSLIPASGGLQGIVGMTLIPCYDFIRDKFYLYTFDYTNFDTEASATLYFPQVDLMPGRQITTSKVMIVYRDIGKCKVKIAVETAQGYKFKEKSFGGIAKDYNKIRTVFFDFVVTGERPQLQITREANSGPFSLIFAKLVTDVELMEQV